MFKVKGKGELLSKFEKGRIFAEKEQGLLNRRFARDLGRCHAVVGNFVKNPARCRTKRSTGRPSLLSEGDNRKREASNTNKSCTKIKSSLELEDCCMGRDE
ncbi:unnamed protein product [Haemonchus placei]|uniref:Homeobox domain-containing protein n=1 Tax=Haemonchus placei TaxID=6290 RepID=A0A0N4WA12_HAEPC|nr:unnamed protein product [Haemonchus placei]